MPAITLESVAAGDLGPEHIGRTIEVKAGFLVVGELTGVEAAGRDSRKILLIIRDTAHGPTMLTVSPGRPVGVWVE